MPRVVHFEICATNPERAARFYKSVFGWKIKKWGGGSGEMAYWLVSTGNKRDLGIDGGILRRSYKEDRTVNTIAVKSLEQSLKKVKKAGGKVITEIMDIPGIGRLAYIEDTEKVCHGLMQPDMKAMAKAKR